MKIKPKSIPATHNEQAANEQATEQDLIRLAAEGDHDAFEELIAPYSSSIFNIGLRMLGNREDALDMTQDVLIKVYRYLPSFRKDSAFFTWIYRISVNTCNDIWRSANRRHENTVSLLQEDIPEPEIADYSNLPEQIYEDKEAASYLKALVDGLSPHYRIVITLREIAGLSYAEISRVTGISEGTVKSRINRARKAMRKQLEADREHYPYLDSLIAQ